MGCLLCAFPRNWQLPTTEPSTASTPGHHRRRTSQRIVIDPWQPKAIAGERVWVPQGDTWVEAEPQPELSSGQLTDTVCSRRGHHNIMGIVSGWNVCLDCDEVTVNH